MAAHELRAPLTAIRGFLSMVIDGDTGPITPKASEFLRDSMVSSERMIRLVNNMLDVGRIEEGRLTLNPSLFNLTAVANAVHGEFQGEAMNKGLAFTGEIAPNCVDPVYVDEDKIHEVVVNLVSNAIKYTETGSVSIGVSNPDVDTVRLDVKDTGSGISPDEQQKLFQKFYRVQSVVGKTIGTGLGLYISKLLIERFGGRIGLISESGKGSDFWFELPIEKKRHVETTPHPVSQT
jgi:signal transduction histidine kinase